MRLDSVGCKLQFGRMGLSGLTRFAALAFAIASGVNGVAARAQAQDGQAAAPAATQSAAPAAQSATAPAASTKDIVGIWQGTLHAGRDLRTELKITKAGDGSLKAAFYSIDQGGQPIPVTKTTFENGELVFTIDVISGKFEGKMSPDGKTITGNWTQGPNPLALTLERTTPDNAWPIPEQPKPMAADANPGFDVATIKPSQPGARGKGFGYGPPGHPNQFVTLNTNMNDLVAFAYGMHSKQIVGAPDWFGTELFDIDGKPDVAGRPSLHQEELMVQKLLLDRFALKFHHDQRELSVYIITVAPSGQKMTKTTAGPNDPQGFGFRGLGDLYVRNMNMKEFASWMQSGVMDRPVVDHTGLTDKYDFHLKWTPDDSQFAQFRGVGATAPPAAGDDPNAPPSLYTAVQETLGLKIEAGKAMDDVIVIDHVEKPSPN